MATTKQMPPIFNTFIIFCLTKGILINTKKTIPHIIKAVPKSGCIAIKTAMIKHIATGNKKAYILLFFLFSNLL